MDNDISEFTDNPNRLNVAISRATKQLILIIHGNEYIKNNNIADLIQYIEYNNFSVINSNLNSIFDYLYKGYEEKRSKIIQKAGKVSKFDSENLMFALIKEVLLYEQFTKYDVIFNFPTRNLINNLTILDEREKSYITNPLTHIDFLIYNKLGKRPVLAIEVDGYNYHKIKTKQAINDKIKDQILKNTHFL